MTFFNRELSWLEFNKRVLFEGTRKDSPLLHRLKFISIFSSNLDEFFMVRVATLKSQADKGNKVSCPSGLAPKEQLKLIRESVTGLLENLYAVLLDDILPSLKEKGVVYKKPSEASKDQFSYLEDYFTHHIFSSLTPVKIESEGDVPSLRNLSINILFSLKKKAEEEEVFAVLPIPKSLKRLIPLPSEEKGYQFTLIEDVIKAFGAALFPGYEILSTLSFRMTKDADLSVDESRDEDFLMAMSDLLIERRQGPPVRLEINKRNKELAEVLISRYHIKEEDVYAMPSPMDMASLMPLAFIEGQNSLRQGDWPIFPSPEIDEEESIFEVLRKKDILLHHPYESFKPVVSLVKEAAKDPEVLSIKMTLYRTSSSSPIIAALEEAVHKGKQVVVVVELKARFDEEQNIQWAKKLEQAGAIVIYGISHLKIHSKTLLVTRRSQEGTERFLHLGTGNYNDKTARLYTDFSLMTAHEGITYEAALFFNAITGYSEVPRMEYLVMAPGSMKKRFLTLINKTIRQHSEENPSEIRAKMNSLSDPDIIKALYEASRAGVKISLNVRGICMLIPGKKGMSENIEVISILDQYLEHSRIYYFRAGGTEDIYMASADWMPRNLERRIELMFPVLDPDLSKRAKSSLDLFFRDNTHAHKLQSDGSYKPVVPQKGEEAIRCQETFFKQAELALKKKKEKNSREFVVRRK